MLKSLSKLLLLLLDFIVIFLNGVVIYEVVNLLYVRSHTYLLSDIAIIILSVFNICFAIYKMKQGKYGKALYGGLSLLVILLYFIIVLFIMF